jgi:hypothetical protein
MREDYAMERGKSEARPVREVTVTMTRSHDFASSFSKSRA